MDDEELMEMARWIESQDFFPPKPHKNWLQAWKAKKKKQKELNDYG